MWKSVKCEEEKAHKNKANKQTWINNKIDGGNMKLDVATSLWNGHSNALSANFHFSTHKKHHILRPSQLRW